MPTPTHHHRARALDASRERGRTRSHSRDPNASDRSIVHRARPYPPPRRAAPGVPGVTRIRDANASIADANTAFADARVTASSSSCDVSAVDWMERGGANRRADVRRTVYPYAVPTWGGGGPEVAGSVHVSIVCARRRCIGRRRVCCVCIWGVVYVVYAWWVDMGVLLEGLVVVYGCGGGAGEMRRGGFGGFGRSVARMGVRVCVCVCFTTRSLSRARARARFLGVVVVDVASTTLGANDWTSWRWFRGVGIHSGRVGVEVARVVVVVVVEA